MIVLSNFESVKLSVPDAWLVNAAVLGLLLLLSMMTLRRGEGQAVLAYEQTTQLKGAAMLLVVFGHFWTHVAVENPWPVLAGESVAVFLMLSGYGLTRSQLQKQLGFRAFFHRRVRRMMLPYWAATVLILCLDWLLLDRTLTPEQLLLTFAEVNQSETLRHLDYVRWYITFQLFWYCCFFVVFSRFSSRLAVAVLTGIAVVLLQVDYWGHAFNWAWYYAFPAGCLLGVSGDLVQRMQRLEGVQLLGLGLSMLVLFLGLKWGVPHLAALGVPSVVAVNLRDISALLYGFGALVLLTVLGRRGQTSLFLLFYGTISYELFLLHGPFMIKYNPFLRILSGRASGCLWRQLPYFLVRCVWGHSFSGKGSQMWSRNRLLLALLLLALPANVYIGYKVAMRLSKTPQNVRTLCVYQDMSAEYRTLNSREEAHGRVVFAGDSIIRRFALDEYFPEVPALNRGIHLDTVPGLLKRWHATVLSANPRQIVVMIGHNDLSVHDDESILRGVRRLFSERKGVPLVFTGILPVGERRSDLNPRIRELNRRIKAVAREFGVQWLSLGPFLTNENGCLAAAYSCDGVHLNGAGYSLWADALRPLISTPM